MKHTILNRAAAMLALGLGSTAARAEPVPLVKPRRPIVSIAAVREAAAPEAAPGVTARAAPEFTPEPFDPFSPSGTLPDRPVIAPFPLDAAMPRTGTTAPFPRPTTNRGSTLPVSATAFDPFATPGQGPAPRPDPRTVPSNSGGIRGLWNGLSSWTSDRVKAVAGAVAGPDIQPDPRVGQPMPPPPYGMPPMANGPMGGMPPMANGLPPGARYPMPPQPFRGVTSGGRPAYAGNPAYRWYGWGTTTPGANPYAPTGDYPNTTAQWYAMSGATPGAFPVPVTNPFRPVPGHGAPAYATNAAPASSPSIPPPSSLALTTNPAPSAPAEPPGPQPIVETLPFRYVPPDELPISTVSVPSVPAAPGRWQGGSTPIVPREPDVPVRAKDAEPAWQPISQSAPPLPTETAPATLVGQMLPRPETDGLEILQVVAREPVSPPSLRDRVGAAAGPEARNLEVKMLSRDHVIVRFDAPSNAVAETAARAIGQLAELKPFTVTFDVVTGR